MKASSTVLVVDDEHEVRELYGMALDFVGYEVLYAADGMEGLRVGIQARPCVVVTDVHMPALDGDEMARRLRELLGVEAPPVVVVTADPNAADALRETGLYAKVLTKPVDPRGLLAAVEAAATCAGSS